ncbi:MAG: hypothetical protein ACP6IY_12360 [Promethearchaeia archaeon]
MRFTREGFLTRDKIYSLEDTDHFQVIIESQIDIDYKFDSEGWVENWGFELAFTGHLGGQDLDWFMKLVKNTENIET